jgi:NitT/TauT family transport system substrate-binding protein
MRPVLLHRRDRQHGDARGVKFFGREGKPIGHASLQRLVNVMSLAYSPRKFQPGGNSIMLLTRRAFTALGLALATAPAKAQQLDKVSFGTNWVAEAEHGGFYQAAADGTYRKYGLDVTIVPGGPQVNNRMLLLAGRIEFFMSANSLQGFDAVAQNIPTIVIAASFQKDPQVLLAHPGAAEKFEDLKKLTILVSSEGVQTYYKWMQAEFGFTENQVKPYTFNPQPFLVDKNSAMQGYVTSEPFAVEKAGVMPKIFLLADQGFNTYSTLIETRRETVEKRPDLMQRFVDASAIGWYNYLYGDNKPANELIRKHNPEMSQELIDYSIGKMKDYGIVDSGDSLKDGIGAMSDARMASFFAKMVKAGVVKPNVDFRKSYTLQFVNKGVGLELRPK